MTNQMRRIVMASLLALVAAACSGTGSTTTSTVTTSAVITTTAPPTTAATTTATTPPPTTVPPATTTTTIAPEEPNVVLRAGGVTLETSAECAGLGEATADGSVTWTDGTQMWEATADGSQRCMFEVTGTIDDMLWGPQGDRLLINGHVIAGGPADGAVLPDNAKWAFSHPTGKNLLGRDENGSVVKYLSDSASAAVLDPVTRHDAVAYHPSGLHIAISGEEHFDPELDAQIGIFIANTDGTDPVLLASSFGAVIVDMAFSADAASIFFLADHESERHLHGNTMVPIELEDGTKQLGAGVEELAATLATTTGDPDYSRVIVHPRVPSLVAWTTDRCTPDGSLSFQAFDGNDLSPEAVDQPLLLERNAAAVGFLGTTPNVVTMATLSGPCEGPFDLSLATYAADSGVSDELPVAGNVTAAATRTRAVPHEYDLVDVDIIGFA